MIDVLEIDERQKQSSLAVASSSDFACHEAGQTDAFRLVSDPTISLYCLDQASRRAVFVQVDEQIDVTAAAFIYMAQYDHAQRVFTVPYELFHQVAAGIELRSPLIFIHSTGRAGSTLLSKVFGAMESVTSLSEPDVYTQIVAMRLNGSADGDSVNLLTSATKLLFNPAFTHGSSLHVVKFRSFCIHLADLLHGAFPSAGNLFLYRDLEPFIRSSVRAFAIDHTPTERSRRVSASLATLTPLLARELAGRETLERLEIPCLIWLSAVHAYVEMHARGVPMAAVRYEELVAEPRRTLEFILGYLQLPDEGLERGLSAFEHDSQADSPLSRQNAATHAGQIDAEEWQVVRGLLRRYPLPDTAIPAVSTVLP